MIYITVGTYPEGFDRLIHFMDDISSELQLNCIAQISGGKYIPKNMEYSSFYSVEDQEKLISKSDFIISHGGFGVIGDMLRKNKEFIVFPRPPEEGPNDQRPVANKLAAMYGFGICDTYEQLKYEIISKHKKNNDRPCYNTGSNIPEIITQYLLKKEKIL